MSTNKNIMTIKEHTEMTKALGSLGWGVRASKFSQSVINKIIDYGINPEMYKEALECLVHIDNDLFIAFDLIHNQNHHVVYFEMSEDELAKLIGVAPTYSEGYDHEEKCLEYNFEYSLKDYSFEEKKQLFNDYLHIAQ